MKPNETHIKLRPRTSCKIERSNFQHIICVVVDVTEEREMDRTCLGSTGVQPSVYQFLG